MAKDTDSDQGKSADGAGNGKDSAPKPKRRFDPGKFSVASLTEKAARPGGGQQVADGRELARPARGQHALSAVLEEAGVVNRDMIEEMVQRGNESAQTLKRSQIQQGDLNEEGILDAFAADLGMDRIHLRDVNITRELLDEIDEKFAKRHRVFPVSSTEDELVVAISDPTNIDACDDLQKLTPKHVVACLAPERELDDYIHRFYEGDMITDLYEKFREDHDDPITRDLERYESIDLDEEDRDLPPVVRFVDLIFKKAVHDGASDIHVEPARGGLVIRFRIDGVLHRLPSPPNRWQNAILSRLKVMSGMDLAEKRVPQDGRIKLSLPDKSLDLRVSALPSIFGETIVMRILDQADVLMGLEDVGFLPDSIERFSRLIRAPNGIILMTGPTGSGKTTTLNSALSTLNNPETKIITVEDPVEYQIQGITQIQANAEVGLDFSIALRSMLRMSPDVIMVGEIRDVETAEIAIRAALTGHLVFSTLHTNDAPSSTIRLIDMGVKPFLVASSIQAVIAQRLIRRICGNCKQEYNVKPEVLSDAELSLEEYRGVKFYKGVGCDRCSGSGYRGRTAIHEIFEMDPEIRKMVIRAESNIRIKKTAIAHGMRTLRHDGMEKVLLGQTTLEEVMRITQLDA